MENKTARGLVDYAKRQLGKPYWYGTFGQTPTAHLLQLKSKQYPPPLYSSYIPRRVESHRQDLGNYDRVHDCIGLIKGYLWTQDENSRPTYDAKQDVSADAMRRQSNPNADLKQLPESPGTLVFMEGHVGVYIGGGRVIEAKGSDFGVQQTELKGRGWKWWGQCPWLVYGESPGAAARTMSGAIQVGDQVRILPGVLNYYPGGARIPSWLRGYGLPVAQVTYRNQPVLLGGKRCVLLGGINSWIALDAVQKA